MLVRPIVFVPLKLQENGCKATLIKIEHLHLNHGLKIVHES